MRTPMEALQAAVEIAGSQAELARRLAEHTKNPKVKQAHVWNWLNRDKEVPAEMAVPIESVTADPGTGKARVYRQELCPKVFPSERAAA